MKIESSTTPVKKSDSSLKPPQETREILALEPQITGMYSLWRA